MRRAIVTMILRLRAVILAACVVTWVAALVATHIPAPEVKVHVSDKVLHMTGFFVLGVLFWLTLAAYGVRGLRRIVLVICIMMVYAAVDETTQAWVNRDPDLHDWMADVLGAAIAVAVLEILRLVTRRATQPPEVPTPEDHYPQYPY